MEFTFKNVVKNTLLLFAVGVAVAYAAPLAISALIAAGVTVEAAVTEHAAGSAAMALWTGAVFGAFGGIHTMMAPLFDRMFGKDETLAAQVKECTGHKHALHVNNVQLAADVDIAKAANFAQRIEQDRNVKIEIART